MTSIYKDALDKWGRVAQICMVMEECAELIQACNKFLRVKTSAEDDRAKRQLADEIADVEIMIEQLKVIIDDKFMVMEHKAMALGDLRLKLEK